jgi:uncharacterized protein YozE (UPF0346 family)
MSRVRYSTNFMGPISLNWYKDRGLNWETEPYSAGRLDFWNPFSDSMFSDEMSVPPMRSEDWHRLSKWLDTFSSEKVLTLDEIVEEYEKTNPKIRWWQSD